MSIPQCTRDAFDLLKELSQEKITLAVAKERAQGIQTADPEAAAKLNRWRQALDAYCAEQSQQNLAATVMVVKTFPGFRELIIEKARAHGF